MHLPTPSKVLKKCFPALFQSHGPQPARDKSTTYVVGLPPIHPCIGLSGCFSSSLIETPFRPHPKNLKEPPPPHECHHPLTDIINANAILDNAEDPAKMIQQIARDMDESLVDVRAAIAANLADRKQSARRIEQLAASEQTRQTKAEFALERGRDDLARLAFAEKSEVHNELEREATNVAQLEQAIAGLQIDAETLEAKRREATARQKSLALRSDAARSIMRVRKQLIDVDSTSVMDRFNHFERKLDELEGRANAFAPGPGGHRSLATEIDALESDHSIDDELHRLKSRPTR
jgi:phage shock protein A